MTDEAKALVKMLRAGDLCGLTLAADRIEALTAENERLRAEIDSIKHFRASFAPDVAEKLFGTHGQ